MKAARGLQTWNFIGEDCSIRPNKRRRICGVKSYERIVKMLASPRTPEGVYCTRRVPYE